MVRKPNQPRLSFNLERLRDPGVACTFQATICGKFTPLIVYAHGRRLCSNWVRHVSTTMSYPQCSLTFMRERYLHRSFAYAKSAVGIDVVSVHKLFAYRVMSTVSTDIKSSHTKYRYCRITYGITR